MNIPQVGIVESLSFQLVRALFLKICNKKQEILGVF